MRDSAIGGGRNWGRGAVVGGYFFSKQAAVHACVRVLLVSGPGQPQHLLVALGLRHPIFGAGCIRRFLFLLKTAPAFAPRVIADSADEVMQCKDEARKIRPR
jgi:hypothetical protein